MGYADFASITLLILSFLLLGLILARHFKGMRYPPYWIYFLGGFSLLSVQGMFATVAPQGESFETVNEMLKLVASFSIFLGSFEIYRRYEAKIPVLANETKKQKKATK